MARPYDHNWTKVRRFVLDRDKHMCRVRLDGCTGRATHVDHIMPLSEGGSRLDPINLRASCQYCNLARNATRSSALANALTAGADAAPSRRW